ncbi:hypothetical protein H0H92_009567 [Tricholoma furcatifolium]|nr:hypothetical protein H0H92_009567 [Tricholoma furcatifolium]
MAIAIAGILGWEGYTCYLEFCGRRTTIELNSTQVHDGFEHGRNDLVQDIATYTKTPVNTVIFDGLLSILFGCLVFVGDQAINAIFAMSIVGNFIAYAIPIAARIFGENNYKPGPFNLGAFVRLANFIHETILNDFIVESTGGNDRPRPSTDARDMNYTVIVLGGILILSVMWYYFPKYGGVHWFTGPVPNITNSSEAGEVDTENTTLRRESSEQPILGSPSARHVSFDRTL